MRFTGYSFEDARTFVTAIGETGRALYLGPQLWLDMVYPPLLGATLFLTYRWLFPGWPGLAIGTVSLASVVVDYLENAALAAMLRAGPDGMSPEMANAASQMDHDEVELRGPRPRDACRRHRLAGAPIPRPTQCAAYEIMS
jgi:hypothetical protein